MTLAERPLASTQLSRSETVEHALRREIVLGTLSPGATLRELDLAQRFKCAQGTIREALMRLSEDGLVSRRARRDTHVAQASPTDAGELLRIRPENLSTGTVDNPVNAIGRSGARTAANALA